MTKESDSCLAPSGLSEGGDLDLDQSLAICYAVLTLWLTAARNQISEAT